MTYNTTARGLAALGRNGDDTLMHVNKNELAGLQALLGPVTVNPKTGMPEAYSWTSMLGSIVGGLGSFGAGAVLEPIMDTALGGAGDGIFHDILSKVVPATVGAGIGAAIGGATGGKGGALGGAAQGFLSGGLGAFGSDDVVGKPTESSNTPIPQQSPTPDYMQTDLDKLLGAQPHRLQSPVSETAPPSDQNFIDQLGNNMGQAYSNLSQPGKLKDLANDYGSYLFQAGLIGQGLADQTNANDQAKKLQEDYRQNQMLRNYLAQQQVNKLFGNVPQYYADGGEVTFSQQGPLPVQVTIPEHLIADAEGAGGIDNLLRTQSANYATGGYINTQQVNPDSFYPQSQIPKARPYLAATPIRHEVLQDFADGGYIDGEGDGMSDDIDADIDGVEPVRVADGEFVVPKHIVDMLGADRLEQLLKEVRKSAYGTDEQISQNAGKLAAQRLLERYT